MRLGCVLLLAVAAGSAQGETATERASRLYDERHYAEACAVLTAVVAKEPRNAEACHLLGLSLLRGGDPKRFDAADPWLLKARELVPGNADYLADYAGNSLELARVHHSYSLAVRGRDLMEKALALDPSNLDGRYGLMQFNAQAPWPLGDSDKAFAQAAEIARRERERGRGAYLWLGRYFAGKGRDALARRAYRELLRFDPRNAAAQAGLARIK